MATAPSNGGFTVTGAGWIRVKLAADSHDGSDIWALPGKTYPLRVAEYTYPTPTLTPQGLSWLSDQLGGYTESKTFDEGESADVEGAIGFYAGGNGALVVDSLEVTLAIGDFLAGHPEDVTFETLSFITAIY